MEEQSDEVPPEVDDNGPGPDTEADEEATRCRRCCRSAWKSSESPTLTAFGLKLVEEKGKSAVIIRAVPHLSQILAWIAYFYVLASTLMFFIGPVSRAWVPQYGVYVTYPFAIMVGAYISFVWTHQTLMLYIELIAGMFAFVVNLFAVLQGMSVLVSDVDLVYQGNTTYPPIVGYSAGSFNQSSIFSLPQGYNKPTQYLKAQVVFYWANMIFALTGFLMVLRVFTLMYSANNNIEPEDRMPLFPSVGEVVSKPRLALTVLSTVFVVLPYLMFCLIVSSWQSWGGYIILALFPNATNSILVMMITASIFPPSGDKHRPNYVKSHPEMDEKVARYRAGLGSKTAHFIGGWILAFLVSISCIVQNTTWRQKNSMGYASGICGDFRPFLGEPGFPGTPGAVITFFDSQNVTFRPLNNHADLISLSDFWTCWDDGLNLYTVSLGFILFVLAMYVVIGSVVSPEDAPLKTKIVRDKRTSLRNGVRLHNRAVEEATKVTVNKGSTDGLDQSHQIWLAHVNQIRQRRADRPLPPPGEPLPNVPPSAAQ